MRIIKFRQFYRNKFHYNEFIDGHIQGFISSSLKENPISQFTGKFDRNNKEIYEGDELKVYEDCWGEIKEWTAIVKFSAASFNLYNPDCCKACKAGIGMICYLDEIPGECEVVGNIYENPKE